LFSGCGVGVVVGCRIVSVSIFITNMCEAFCFVCVCCVILRNVNIFCFEFLVYCFFGVVGRLVDALVRMGRRRTL
ncbi:hypothetical protein ACRQEC_09485, partial [Actinotignum sp. GS-2025c]|uniref:hypothetical protein n=1 Tax=Actinotignum sp. GS-2025c TaxID=3427276 RepID=UPI003F45C93F